MGGEVEVNSRWRDVIMREALLSANHRTQFAHLRGSFRTPSPTTDRGTATSSPTRSVTPGARAAEAAEAVLWHRQTRRCEANVAMPKIGQSAGLKYKPGKFVPGHGRPRPEPVRFPPLV
mmetsp:Transcript_7630/g.16414  ORF Transcript_7630/g.16414 Transcript_7630/m.16414 type:complete len:119 (+) Transcript_7630:60-416(+)